MRTLLLNDYLPTADRIRELDPGVGVGTNPPWDDIAGVLPDVVSDIDVTDDQRDGEGRPRLRGPA